MERLETADPDAYMKDLITQHLEVLEKTVRGTLDDPNRGALMLMFTKFLGEERGAAAMQRALTYPMEERAERIFREEWRRMGLADRMDWARFVEKWRAPLYGAHTFGELAAQYMESASNVEFAARSGISYSAISKTVVPQLRGAGVERVK